MQVAVQTVDSTQPSRPPGSRGYRRPLGARLSRIWSTTGTASCPTGA
jgi:hypothetical protein